MKTCKTIMTIAAAAMLLTACSRRDAILQTGASAAGAVPGKTALAAATQYFYNPLFAGDQPDPYFYPEKDALGNYYYFFSEGDRLSIRKVSNPAYVQWSAVTTLFMGATYGLKQIWAPELHRINGFWYLYFTATKTDDAGHRIYMMKNTHADPTDQTWTEPYPMENMPNSFAIDPNIMQTADGSKKWLLWTGRGTDGVMRIYYGKLIYPQRVDPATIKLLAQPTYAWEKADGPVNEAPQFLRKDAQGIWFIYFSANGTNSPDKYCLGRIFLKQGGNPDNPADWVKHPSPVFQTSVANSVYSPGHCSFFTAGTEWWIAYHAKSVKQNTYGGRTARIQEFTWYDGHTPVLGTPVKTGIQTPVPGSD